MCKYNTTQKAERFALSVNGTATDVREKKCINKALAVANVPAGANVLDLPCGTGRLIPLLKKRGYKVTAADVSEHMLAQAKYYMGQSGENCIDEKDNFQLANILKTDFEGNCFDAVVCHRLFQYFSDSKTRQQVLKELRRICSGPIIVSFLCNVAIDEVWDFILNITRKRNQRGCISISYRTFRKDALESGLIIKKWILMRPLISKRWCAVLEQDKTQQIITTKMTSPLCFK